MRARSSSVRLAPPGLAHSNMPPGGAPRLQSWCTRRLAVELAVALLGQHLGDVGGSVHVEPAARRVHRVVRVGEADPPEERRVLDARPFEPVDGRSRRSRSSGGPPRRSALRQVWVLVPGRPGCLGLHGGQALVALGHAVAVEPAAVVQAERRRSEAPVPVAHERCGAQVVAEQEQLHLLEAEVRAGPVVVHRRRPLDRLELARWAGRGRSWRSAPCRRSRCGGRCRAKVVATDRSTSAAGRSRPLKVTPWVEGIVPVRIVARAGWQNGFCVRQAEKRVPCAASRSRFGVWQTGLP